jgi:hypothetical protein
MRGTTQPSSHPEKYPVVLPIILDDDHPKELRPVTLPPCCPSRHRGRGRPPLSSPRAARFVFPRLLGRSGCAVERLPFTNPIGWRRPRGMSKVRPPPPWKVTDAPLVLMTSSPTAGSHDDSEPGRCAGRPPEAPAQGVWNRGAGARERRLRPWMRRRPRRDGRQEGGAGRAATAASWRRVSGPEAAGLECDGVALGWRSRVARDIRARGDGGLCRRRPAPPSPNPRGQPRLPRRLPARQCPRLRLGAARARAAPRAKALMVWRAERALPDAGTGCHEIYDDDAVQRGTMTSEVQGEWTGEDDEDGRDDVGHPNTHLERFRGRVRHHNNASKGSPSTARRPPRSRQGREVTRTPVAGMSQSPRKRADTERNLRISWTLSSDRSHGEERGRALGRGGAATAATTRSPQKRPTRTARPRKRTIPRNGPTSWRIRSTQVRTGARARAGQGAGRSLERVAPGLAVCMDGTRAAWRARRSPSRRPSPRSSRAARVKRKKEKRQKVRTGGRRTKTTAKS